MGIDTTRQTPFIAGIGFLRPLGHRCLNRPKGTGVHTRPAADTQEKVTEFALKELAPPVIKDYQVEFSFFICQR